MELDNLDNLITLDEITFEKLFKSNFKGLCLFALRFVKDYDVAKEITQDAFISLWEKRDTIDLSRQVKSYLATAIRNKSFNYLRDNKKFNNEIQDFERIVEPDYKSNDLLENKELKAEITRAIDELPEKCREVFMLSRFENKKYQEIADKLQISIKTVEAQMSKALQHMRIRLAEYIAIFILLLINKIG